MAMIGSGKGFTKKDINFFEEYTAAARRTARYLVYFIFAALVVIAVFVIWWLISFLQNNQIKKEISALQTKIESDDYKNAEIIAAKYEVDLANRNNQLYAMSMLRNQVDTTNVAETVLLDLLLDNITSDTYIQSYELSGDSFVIEGQTFSYYAAVNIVELLESSENIFNSDRPVMMSLERVNEMEVVDDSTGAIDLINCFYSFRIEGSLTNNVTVTVSSCANVDAGVVPLGAPQTYTFAYNDHDNPYVAENVTTLEYNGVTYSLTGVVVDHVALQGDELGQVLTTGTHTISNITSNIEVTYYYSVAVAATAEGGEA